MVPGGADTILVRETERRLVIVPGYGRFAAMHVSSLERPSSVSGPMAGPVAGPEADVRLNTSQRSSEVFSPQIWGQPLSQCVRGDCVASS